MGDLVEQVSQTGVIVILGPTATGKSDVALRVARRLNGRIIGADSIQVYRGLDAGSCKPPLEARREIPHELIDVADLREPFSAGRFARMAAAAIDRARVAGQTPIVVGGTGLYLRALLRGIAPMPQRDDAIRQELYARADREGPEALHRELERLDPPSARRIAARDLQRTVRALEVTRLTGIPFSRHLSDHAGASEAIPAVKAGLAVDRDELYRRVDERVDGIFLAGLVGEVAGLLAAGVPPEANAFKALGYRETLAHLKGGPDLKTTIDLVKRNTRRYARRQLTWFRAEAGVRWLDAGRLAPDAIAGRIVELHAGRGD